MSGYPREELEAMVEHWLEANRIAEESGDWRSMVDCYADDAHYGWNYGPEVDFMANGKDEIRDWAIGLEMDGLAGWTYPYESIIIDDKKGMVIGLWRQVADAKRDDGSEYQTAGIGGSWFKYAGNMQWAWQRDWFDLGNVVSLFFELMGEDKLSEGMQNRMKRPLGPPSEGHYKIGEAPKPIWPEDR
ncbi:MAG: nuclear transport factor 2 family protein [Actinobacteria bacterium]|nr:nuclear transport factor 2 family protein [Actinomycetota bacterium]